jgi:hypothetical protein
VCTGWCALLAERSLWTRLDLSHTSGVTHEVTPALLRAAAAKAGGALTALDVSGVWHLLDRDALHRRLYGSNALREVVAANARTLREVRCLRGRGHTRGVDRFVLAALLSAAPQLRMCEADIRFDPEVTCRALRNVSEFKPLRVRSADVYLYTEPRSAIARRHTRLCAAVAAHASLAELALTEAAFCEPRYSVRTRLWTLRRRCRCCAPSSWQPAACRATPRPRWRAC